jgi:hypothetical protein
MICLRNDTPNRPLVVTMFELFRSLFGRRYSEVGVIASLSKQCGGNVHESGLVAITGSSTMKGFLPQNAAYLASKAILFSLDLPDQWLCYNFTGAAVRLSRSALRTHPAGPHMR